MTLSEMTDLQTQIENMCYRQWEALPEPKPTYTKWWYKTGGPMEAIKALFEKMKDALLKETIVPVCPEYKGKCRRYLVVCQQCSLREKCLPYEKTMDELQELLVA